MSDDIVTIELDDRWYAIGLLMMALDLLVYGKVTFKIDMSEVEE